MLDSPPNTQGLNLHLTEGPPGTMQSMALQMPMQQLVAIWQKLRTGTQVQVWEKHEEGQIKYEGEVFEKHMTPHDCHPEYRFGIDGIRTLDNAHRGYAFNLINLTAIKIIEQATIVDIENNMESPDENAFQQSEDFFSTQPRLEQHAQQEDEKENVIFPTLSDGNIDQFLVMVRYAIENIPPETPEEFKTRIGIRQYLQEHKDKSEKVPIIWNTLTLVLPEAISEVYKVWFDRFEQHNLPFDTWWNEIGQLDIHIEDENNVPQAAGQHMRAKIDEISERAKEFIEQSAPHLQPRLINLYGIWMYGVTKTHFTPFEVYANQDSEYIKLFFETEKKDEMPQKPEPGTSTRQWNDVMPTFMSTDIQQHEIADYIIPDTDTSENHLEMLYSEGNVFLQTFIDQRCDISQEDFMPGGRLSHIYIPNYPYVPPMAIEILTGERTLTKVEYPLMHRRLLLNRKMAAIKCEELDNNVWTTKPNPAPDIDTLWGYVTQNPLLWPQVATPLDEVQHFSAHARFQEILANKDRKQQIRDIYDTFVRPIERLFGRDMPLSPELLLSIKDPVKQIWLTRQINHIAGITADLMTMEEQPLQEISRIRHLTSAQLQQDYNDDPTPPHRIAPIIFKIQEGKRFNYYAESWNELSPKSDDFYPQGRLHGTYLDPLQPIPDYIYKRFSNRKMTEKNQRILQHEIVMARAEWSKEVITQLKVQTGLTATLPEPLQLPSWLEKPNLFPKWIKDFTMNISSSEKKQKPKTEPILISVEDFKPTGTLYGTQRQTMSTIENDVIAKLGKQGQVLKTAQKKLVIRVNKILSVMPSSQQQQPSQTQQMVNNIKATTINLANQATNLVIKKVERKEKTPPPQTATASSNTVSKPSSSRQLSKEQTSATKMMRLATLKPIKEESHENVDWSQAPLFDTDWAQEMDDEDQLRSEVKISKIHHRPTSESPQIPQKRRVEVAKTTTTTSAEKWIKKEETKNVQAPPLVRAESLFQTPISRKPTNPFHWNGNQKNTPEWAKSKQSANDIGYIPQNTVPLEQKSRIQIAAQMRKFPTDGVHRIQNITIQRNPATKDQPINRADRHQWPSIVQMLITSQSKERKTSMQTTEPVQMSIPVNDWKAFRALLTEVRQAVLPPAEHDEQGEDRIIAFQMNGQSNIYMADVTLTRGIRGIERLTRIVQTRNGDPQMKGFAFPWRYTVMFADKWTATTEEIMKECNDEFKQASVTTEKLSQAEAVVKKEEDIIPPFNFQY